MGLERNTIRLARRAAISAAMLAAASIATGASHAADKYVLEEVEETRVELGTGWYIRGGVGVSSKEVHRESEITVGATDFTDDISTVFGFRVGAGMRVSPNIRLDATFDYHTRSSATVEGAIIGGCMGERELQGTDVNGNQVTYLSPVPGLPCATRDTDEYDQQDLMVNAYHDFSPLGQFTPYIGASLGLTRFNYSSRRGDVVCSPPDNVRCADPFYGIYGDEVGEDAFVEGAVDQGTSYHLAGGVTFGLSYAVSKNLSVDASYQLTKTLESPLWGGSNGYEVMGVDSFRHAARVGLRYELW